MFPIGSPSQGKPSKVRKFPFVIVPLDPPKDGIPEGSLYMESLVFSLIQHPPERVLSDYCKFKGLDVGKFKCHPVIFAKDLRRDGKGTLCIRRDGDRFHGRINWRR